VVESRLSWAKRFGADATPDAAGQDLLRSVLDATEGRGVDAAIVASGNVKAIRSSFPLVRKGGKILLFGIPPQSSLLNYDVSDIFIREITMISSYSTTEDEIRAALDMMASGKIRLSEMITHRFPLAEIADAFRMADDARLSLKVMVHG
jgi:L-iditol 2-dehydrogenase